MKVLLPAVATLILAGQLAGPPAAGQPRSPSVGTTHGPSRGSLVLQGGVGLNPAVASRFVALAGGASAHIVLVPTASVGDAGPPGMETYLARRMKGSWGVDTVTVMHSLDRDTADSDRFIEPLRRATGVWMLGGFPQNLVRSYLATKTERSIRELLDRGGVVGGESAGAMIQASWIDTTDDEDFTPDTRALIAANGPAGFNLLTRAAVFPHFDARGPDAAVRFITDHADHVGIGIDDETALVVQGVRAEVVGDRSVRIYDGRRGRGANPVVLRSGERYDFSARQ